MRRRSRSRAQRAPGRRIARRSAGLLALGLLLGLSGAAAQAPPPTPPPGGGTLPPPPTRPPGPLPTAPRPTPSVPPVTAPPADDPGGSSTGLVLPTLVALGVLAGGYLVVRNRVSNRNAGRLGVLAPPSAPTPTSATSGPGALTHELLEVSRQLTAASVTGDVKRATVRGALSLVPAEGAALVTVDDTGGLVLAVESTPDLLVPEQLGHGVLGRVAETGDHVELISASEPAIRNRPACVLALPLVAGGRVAAVLVVTRAKDQPFTPNETRTLRALAPMAAAVLQSERHAQSAIEDSLLDPLTGANNRRRFDRDLSAAMTKATASGIPVSLAIVDLDHFKRVNDTHGHPAGDALLKAVVAKVQQAVRPGDGVYRFGGEEFCVLFTDTAGHDAADVAERVRAAIAAGPFDVGTDQPLPATASIGVATAATAATADADDLLARADAALYAAKEGGRNRVVAA